MTPQVCASTTVVTLGGLSGTVFGDTSVGTPVTLLPAGASCSAGGTLTPAIPINTSPQVYFQFQTPPYGTQGSLVINACNATWSVAQG
jgi:hypothetical protein